MTKKKVLPNPTGVEGRQISMALVKRQNSTITTMLGTRGGGGLLSSLVW
jgi:hypothetical protein